jgi:hypothetical protein
MGFFIFAFIVSAIILMVFVFNDDSDSGEGCILTIIGAVIMALIAVAFHSC